MIFLIDNNDGRGQQDYTAWADVEHLPTIARKLNRAATMTAALVSGDPGFTVPVSGAHIILQCGSGVNLFTGYLATAPEQEYLGVVHRRQRVAPRWPLMSHTEVLLLRRRRQIPGEQVHATTTL